MKIVLPNEISISPIQGTDKAAYVEHLQNREIYENTLRIPHPYTEMDADEWLRAVFVSREHLGTDVVYAIRNASGYLIGSVGFDDFVPRKSHKAEMGYWLAKPYWGRGIMTDAVKQMVQYGREQFQLSRISATVFYHNIGSQRVLEKAGFQCEGVLAKYYQKDERFLDAKVFAFVF